MGTVISNIPKIAFSQNEIAVTLTSDDYLSSEGVAAVYILNWTSPVSRLDWIEMQFDFYKREFLAIGNTANSYDTIPVQGSLSRAEYTLSLIEALKRNYFLSNSYLIEVGPGDTVKLTARKSGEEFKILSTGLNFFLTLTQAPVDHLIKKNFNHYIEVWNKEDKIFESLLPLNYPISGITTIDISGILHSSMEMDVPDLKAIWQKCDKSIFSYYLKYSRAFGDPLSVKALNTSEVKHVTLGGYSMMALAHIESTDHLEKFLLSDPALYELQNWFESYPVDDVEIKTNQPHFLYFINSRDVAETFKIKVIAVFEDSTISELILDGGILESFQKACIAVGYKELGLDALSIEENKIVSYSVQLLSDNSPRTISKRFLVNRCYEANTRYFLYAGSDGNFKTLRTYGGAEGNMELSKEIGVLESTQNRRIEFGDVLTFDVVSYENEVLSTGYIMSRHSHEAIKEFMLTTRAFRVIGDKLIPIEVLSKGMPLPTELNKTGFVKIEYRLAWDDRFFTGDTSALNVPSISQSQQALNDI